MLFDLIIVVSAYSPLVAFIASTLLCAWIFLANPKGIKNILYAIFGLDLAIWAYSCFIQSITKDYSTALFFDQILYSIAAIAPALFLHCISLFTGINRKREIFASYFVGAVFLLLNWTPFFRIGVGLNFGMRYVTVPGPGWYLYIIAYSIIVVLALYDLLKAISQRSGEEKTQLLLVLYAFIVLLFGGQSYFILIFKKFNYLADSILNLSSSVLLASYNFMMALIITKQRFLNIKVVISRVIAEILTLSFFGMIYAAVFWLYRRYVSANLDLLFLIINILFSAVTGRTHHGIRLFFQTTSDKVFLRGKYNYYKELSNASAKVGRKMSLASILGILYDTFHDVIEISNPRIFLPESFSDPQKPSGRYLVYERKTFSPQSGGPAVAIDSPLINKLIASRRTECMIREIDAHLVTPCLLEDRLIAFFALGPKLSEDPYTDEDIRLLEVLASQVAVALDHTRSYEKIKNDLDANQQKLFEAERQLERSQRLASLGTLTAGVTHEIRNPMAIIKLQSEILFDKPRDNEYLKRFQKTVIENVDRVQGIIDGMLKMAKSKGSETFSDVNLNEIIEKSLTFFTIDNFSLVKELNPAPPIKGNAGDLHRVFINLIQNALEAMSGNKEGVLKIKTYVENQQAVAAVSDTGRGIPKEIQGRIFDPFFSTRHEGVGLGLSITHHIIEQHKGSIEVQSKEGGGTIFTVRFPVSA